MTRLGKCGCRMVRRFADCICTLLTHCQHASLGDPTFSECATCACSLVDPTFSFSSSELHVHKISSRTLQYMYELSSVAKCFHHQWYVQVNPEPCCSRQHDKHVASKYVQENPGPVVIFSLTTKNPEPVVLFSLTTTKDHVASKYTQEKSRTVSVVLINMTTIKEHVASKYVQVIQNQGIVVPMCCSH